MTEPATLTILPDALARASGEVRAKRRTFTATEKLRLLREAERCAKGELGALLRREGIYSSQLSTWRWERDRSQLAGLTPRKRGPAKRVDEQVQRLTQVERENGRLQARLGKAELIIDAQKKVVAGARLAGAGTARDERDRLMQSIETLAAQVGVQTACEALSMPRSSV